MNFAKTVKVWALAGEIGLLLSLPLVILVPIAVKLDRTLNTLPLFVMAGLILSAVVSTIAVARKVKAATPSPHKDSSLDKGRLGGIL